MFDSLNRHYLPPYGNDWSIAPNFKRLADKSVTFENSYIGSMPCMPARRELHTGRYNFLHREWGPIEPFDDSMPELLKKSGVYSHLISDHFHYWEDGGSTYHNRYSSWEVVRGQEGDAWKGEVEEPEIPEVVRVPQSHDGGGPSSLWRYEWVNRKYMKSEEKQPQSKVFSMGAEFIEKNVESDNWMLHLETFDPHEPFFVQQHYLDMYEDDYQGAYYDWPRGEADEDSEVIEHVRKRYAALLTMCDRNLGKVLDLMDKHNMWKDTMLIVGTDHGFLLGEHGWWGKNLMPYYNKIAHTPLFIWDPRSAHQNERRQSLVQMIDWAPTLLDYFNIDIPKDMQGKPLKETIAEDKIVRKASLFGVHGGHVNITDGKYLYMRAPVNPDNKPLYNYTLMPVHMKKRFDVEELKQTEYVEPFDFTKGVKVLKTPAKDKYQVHKYGHLLFDLENDPEQLAPLKDPKIESMMIQKMVEIMKESDSPQEQFERLGLQIYMGG
nr:sulfatase [Bacillus sp. FJAT-50079]